jgi:hypothetical protein
MSPFQHALGLARDLHAMYGLTIVRHRCPYVYPHTKSQSHEPIICGISASVYFIGILYALQPNSRKDIFGVCTKHADAFREDNVKHNQGYTEITREEALVYEIMES